MDEDTLKQVNSYLDKQIKTLREENARLMEAQVARIAELEAQVPKVVVPCYVTRLFTYGGPIQGFCPEPCNGTVNGRMMFCPTCGAKLDWTEVAK